jgi:hypothetical protein
MCFHLENAEGKETWEAIEFMKQPIYFNTEEEILRRIRTVKKESNCGAVNVNGYIFYT